MRSRLIYLGVNRSELLKATEVEGNLVKVTRSRLLGVTEVGGRPGWGTSSGDHCSGEGATWSGLPSQDRYGRVDLVRMAKSGLFRSEATWSR